MLNNWGLKLISLVLAFLLWFLVVQMGDPKDDRDMGNIQVRLVNTDLLEKENKVYEILEGTDTVRVTVYAPKSVFTQLRNSDIIAEADVSKLTDINTVPISFTASNSNVISIQGSHDVVKLNVEEKQKRYVTLTTSVVGEVRDGYVITTLTPDQNRIEIVGPKSAVEQVREARAEIDVTDAYSNLMTNVDINLYDADGNLVERTNLTKNVNYVRISVEVLKMKEVPLRFETAGTPEKGYMFTGEISGNPDTVRIAGSESVLARISEIVIPGEALDITGASENIEHTVDIREYLQENVKLADSGFNGRIAVTVYIEPIVEKTFQIFMRDISVSNVPAGFEAEINESAESIIPLELSGLSDQIQPLRQGGISGVVDIAAWMEEQGMETLKTGSYTIPVTFVLDERIVVKNPPSVRIVISETED